MNSSSLVTLVKAALAAAVLLFAHGAAAQTLYYLHADHLNTPRLLTDQNQAVVWRWDQTEPFGNSVGVGSMGRDGFVVTVPMRYPGQYFDKETNLHYNYHRWYDPAIGRYTQFDLIGLAGGINGYAYVRANPLSLTDPLGLQATGGSGSQNCPSPVCNQSYFDCLANCIRTNDPLNDPTKLGLTALGGTFPKSWVGLPSGLGGASPVTTVPSAAAYASGGGAAGTAGAIARGVGRVFSPIWIGYGLGMVAVEGMCAIACAGDACMY